MFFLFSFEWKCDFADLQYFMSGNKLLNFFYASNKIALIIICKFLHFFVKLSTLQTGCAMFLCNFHQFIYQLSLINKLLILSPFITKVIITDPYPPFIVNIYNHHFLIWRKRTKYIH